MGFVIDTSAIIELERGSVSWQAILGRTGDEPAYLSAIGWGELLAGVYLADNAPRALARRRKLEAVATQVIILPFTAEIGETWAELFAELQRAGHPIPANDLAIAATAVFHKHQLLVGRSDEAHFRRIRRRGSGLVKRAAG